MPTFDFNKWWLDNVGPEDNLMDQVYRGITKDAIDAVLKFHGVDVKEQMEKDSIDLDGIDFSSVL
jgi:hypothetical protein